MFFLKKLITAFLIPPGVFVLAFLLAAVWFIYKRRLRMSALNLLAALSIWIVSITPVSNVFLRGLEKGLALSDPRGDVIVLLGGGVYDGVPDLTGSGAPSEDMTERVVAAVRLQRKINVPVIVSGGRAYDYRKPEAPIDGRFLIDLGVPQGEVILEESSRDTIENALYTRRLLDRYGFRMPILVTSAYHMRRSVKAFRHAGVEVTPFPTGFRTWAGRKYGPEDYLPSARNLSGVAVALKEYLGLFSYRLFYKV